MNYIRRAGCPHPAASLRGYPSTGGYPRRGRRPRRPGNLLPPPIPGKTPGPGMPGPYRAAAGKPPAVRKRPRRGQDPSLRTAPSTSARPYRADVNYIRRAGCPHPAASSRGHPSTGGHPRRGLRPRRPGNPPVTAHPRENLRAGYARPLPRGGGQAPCRPQTPTEGSRPLPTNRPINECRPPAARRGGNATKKPRRSLFPGLPRFFI